MDPILALTRLPLLSERAIRAALRASLERGAITPRALIDDALVRFERAVQSSVPDGVRPATLFAERDRIVRELRAFLASRLATRLAALTRRNVIAVGRAATPFDAIVRNRQGELYALAFRRVPMDGSRLEALRRLAESGRTCERWPIAGILVYDLNDARTKRVNRDLGTRGELQLRENVRDVVLDRLVG